MEGPKNKTSKTKEVAVVSVCCVFWFHQFSALGVLCVSLSHLDQLLVEGALDRVHVLLQVLVQPLEHQVQLAFAVLNILESATKEGAPCE